MSREKERERENYLAVEIVGRVRSHACVSRMLRKVTEEEQEYLSYLAFLRSDIFDDPVLPGMKNKIRLNNIIRELNIIVNFLSLFILMLYDYSIVLIHL